MSRRDLEEFINQVDHIKVMFAPGVMSADGAGGKSSAQELVYELKKKVAAVNDEYSKAQPDKNVVEALKNDIEGILLGLNSMNAVDNGTLGAMLGQLRLI